MPRRLIIGEGIETVLAVWTAHKLTGRSVAETAFWAAGDLGNLAGRATATIDHPYESAPMVARNGCRDLILIVMIPAFQSRTASMS